MMECKSEVASPSSAENTRHPALDGIEPKPAEICPTANTKQQLLLVEDHDDTRLVMERFLIRAGFKVSAAADLKSALQFLEDGPFDVIISDIALPDGTGYAFISEARRRGVRALAIALSAYCYPMEVFGTQVTGFDHHLRKPFDPAMLRLILGLENRAPLAAAR